MTTSVRRHHLDWVRLSAALCVFVGHTRDIRSGQSTWWAHLISDQAVNVFFVVSGALILSSAERLDMRSFLVHRVARVYPALLAVLVVTASVLSPLAAATLGTAWSPSQATSYVLKNLALVPAWQTSIGGSLPESVGSTSWNSPLWTLFFEVCCYAGILLVSRIFIHRRREGLILAAAVLIAIHSCTSSTTSEFVHTASRLGMAFIIGALVSVLRTRKEAVAAVLLVVIPALAGNKLPLILCCLAFVVLRLPGLLDWQPRSVPADISYGIYIWHWPILQTVAVFFHGSAELKWGVHLLVALGPLCLVALLSWVAVEEPFLRRARMFSTPRRIITP